MPFPCVDGGVAVGADGLQVVEAPGIVLEVGVRQSDNEGAHPMVDLVRRGEPPLFEALLAEAAIPCQHLLTDGPPAGVVVNELVAAVVVAGGFLGFGLRTVDAWHG